MKQRLMSMAGLLQHYNKRVCLYFLIVIAVVDLPLISQAQTDTTTASTTVETISPVLEFKAIQNGVDSIYLKALLRAKVNGSFIKLPLLKISFYQITDSADIKLGQAITDANGKVSVAAKPNWQQLGEEGKIQIKAVFAGVKSIETVEETMGFKQLNFVLTAKQEDSVRVILVSLSGSNAGTVQPVAETTIGIYVKRLFNPLKVGELTTDANGEGRFEFPGTISGDAKGDIVILAKIDEHETFGNVEVATTQRWGVAVSDVNQELPRALWSPHPPLWMVITFIVLVTVVWGHYIVIIYELIRLRKEEPHTPMKELTA